MSLRYPCPDEHGLETQDESTGDVHFRSTRRVWVRFPEDLSRIFVSGDRLNGEQASHADLRRPRIKL